MYKPAMILESGRPIRAARVIALLSILLIAACSGGGGSDIDRVEQWFFTSPQDLAQARVDRTVYKDGRETLHGETVHDYNPYFAARLEAVEDVELDADGRLVWADLSLRNTIGQTVIEKRITLDVAAGEIHVTRPAGYAVWPVPNDVPWIYYPFASDMFFGLPTSSPVAAWVIARGAAAEDQARWVLWDYLVEDVTDTSATTYEGDFFASIDAFRVDADFVEWIEPGALGGGRMERTDVDPGTLAGFTVAPGVTPLTWPDCTLPGTSADFSVTSSDAGIVFGTVNLPATGTAPYPFVVFNAGTGGADREEVIGGIPRWTCLAKPLLEAGIAVARYDDRGHGETGGPLVDFATRSHDAAAVASYVAARSDLDTTRLFLLGHSEGVAHVSEAAVAVPEVDGLLLVAGIGTNGGLALVEQGETLLEGYGMPATYVADFMAQQQQFIDQVNAGTYTGDTGGFPIEFWEQFFQFDGGALAAAANRPTAIFQGGVDWQVDRRHALLLRDAILGAGQSDVTVYEYENNGHFVSPAPTTHPSMSDEYFLPINWNAQLQADLVAWIQAH